MITMVKEAPATPTFPSPHTSITITEEQISLTLEERDILQDSSDEIEKDLREEGDTAFFKAILEDHARSIGDIEIDQITFEN